MAIIFLDRAGQPLSPIDWRALYSDPAYSIVRRDVAALLTVETTWVGVISDLEKHPTPWVVISSKNYAKTDDTSKRVPQAEIWCSTEKLALAKHEELLRGGCKGK